ncbi:hypothetical protein Leryth_004693 [Lithospermum erythrorhizon]|uniref:Uncharacterized protein n=1 Tax=Lithospermum erythrorhizon TaxID=34254 RepID=A0AAV3RI51_LITER|nr:hypothetical protein Leryth_004693 [Lithospermum erythrorhizon]
MDCIVMPVSALRRRYSETWGSQRRLSYQPLVDEDNACDDDDQEVTLVVGVGEDISRFIVDPSILQQVPFRNLMDIVMSKEGSCNGNRGGGGGGGENKKSRMKNGGGKRKVIFVDVEAMLFEHMLWLMQNDESSLLELNLREIVDFYS